MIKQAFMSLKHLWWPEMGKTENITACLSKNKAICYYCHSGKPKKKLFTHGEFVCFLAFAPTNQNQAPCCSRGRRF